MNTTVTPSLKRRLASMLYEAMLMFGVLFISGLLFAALLEQRHALYLRSILQVLLFLLMGMYFIWFWTHGGQTLAMKTWRIRLETPTGGKVTAKQALVRYALSWLWIVPGLAIAWLIGAKNWPSVLIPAANILLWGLGVYLDPQRQFLHDRLAGTRIIGVPEEKKGTKQ
ncbi:RDD family protein [Noviherbaspirillum agri]